MTFVAKGEKPAGVVQFAVEADPGNPGVPDLVAYAPDGERLKLGYFEPGNRCLYLYRPGSLKLAKLGLAGDDEGRLEVV